MKPMLAAWKFLIGPRGRTTAEGLYFSNCVAVAIAETEEEAREIIRREIIAADCNHSWLDVATVTQMELKKGIIAISF